MVKLFRIACVEDLLREEIRLNVWLLSAPGPLSCTTGPRVVYDSVPMIAWWIVPSVLGSQHLSNLALPVDLVSESNQLCVETFFPSACTVFFVITFIVPVDFGGPFRKLHVLAGMLRTRYCLPNSLLVFDSRGISPSARHKVSSTVNRGSLCAGGEGTPRLLGLCVFY